MEVPVSDPIAVIGIACRLPRANNPLELWSLLKEGHSAWSEVPSSRFNWESFYHPHHERSGTTNHYGGHFLSHEDVGRFDARFFGISSTEASAMDPQQRMQLELSYEAFENAGVSTEHLRGSNTGVYMATFSHDYDTIISKDLQDIPRYNAVGTGAAILSNRISHYFDLRGPSMVIDTGCSGSMVALHQACQSLRIRESDMALAGGVNLILTPDIMVTMSMMHMLSSDGKCYSFDDRGEGYGRGEGAGVVVLKRFSDAVRDNDPVRAIIRSSAINFDGRTNGVTLPNSDAQYKLLESIYSSFDPQDIGYFEAHGTGTIAGDAAEFGAISKIFDRKRRGDTPLYLGSIKSNIGHLEGASGIAGLIKVILALEHGQIPPNPDFVAPKASVDLSSTTIHIPTKLQDWPAGQIKRASVNSFGYGGVNGHAVIDGVLPDNAVDSSTRSTGSERLTNGTQDHSNDNMQVAVNFPQIFLITANSKDSLLSTAAQVGAWIRRRRPSQENLYNLAYTFATRRSLLSWRATCVASNSQQLASGLDFACISPAHSVKNIALLFVFTGQGAQWPQMGNELLKLSKTFRESMETSDRVLKSIGASWSILSELLRDESTSRVDESEIAQPLTTAIQIALVDLLSDLQIKPKAVIGHSSGEIAAAYAAGAISQEAALRIAYARGSLSGLSAKRLAKKGAMLAVGLGEAEVSSYLSSLKRGVACVACTNSPKSTTVSGDESAIVELEELFRAVGIFARKVKVDTAYHSHHMLGVTDDYLHSMRRITASSPKSEALFVSTVTGQLKEDDFGVEYWVKNLVSQVRFSEGLRTLWEAERNVPASTNKKLVLLELGPHSILASAIQQTLSEEDTKSITYAYVPTLIRRQDACQTVFKSLAKLAELGYPVDLEQVNASVRHETKVAVIMDLEPYPWDHSTAYWHESRLSREFRFRHHGQHDLLGSRIISSTPFEPVWRNLLSIGNLPWLREHVIDNAVVYPGSAYVCMALEAGRQIYEDQQAGRTLKRYRFKNIDFTRALVIPEEPKKVEIQLVLKLASSSAAEEIEAHSWSSFSIYAMTNGVWHKHCTGLLMIEGEVENESITSHSKEQGRELQVYDIFKKISARVSTMQLLSAATLYKHWSMTGNSYERNFMALRELQIGERQLTARLKVPDVAKSMPANYMSNYAIHPATMDGMFQSVIPLCARQNKQGSVMINFLGDLSISAKVAHVPGQILELATSIQRNEGRADSIQIVAFQEQEYDCSAVFELINGEVFEMRSSNGFGTQEESLKKPLYQLEWLPDVNFATANTIRQRVHNDPALEELSSQRSRVLKEATSVYVRRCLQEIEEAPLQIPNDHRSKLVQWMHNFSHTQFCQDSISRMADPAAEQRCLDQARGAGIEGEIITRIGCHIGAILTAQIDPLTLLFQDDLLYRFYSDDLSKRAPDIAAEYFRLLTFKNPSASILEIGAGTGGTTLPLLKAAKRNGRLCIGRYHFTDISPAFMEKAKGLFQSHASCMDFKPLDIEKDPEMQGFKAESYDCIVASNVLHATRIINNTLQNVYKLLKPGGKLILIEMTHNIDSYFLSFGVLPGWWLGEQDGRKDSPILSTNQWDDALRRADFTGADIVLEDFEGNCQRCSVLISTRRENLGPLVRPISIVPKLPEGAEFLEISKALQTEFAKKGVQSTMSPWLGPESSDDSIHIVLDDARSPFLSHPSHESFRSMTKHFSQNSCLLWVSVRSGRASSNSLQSDLITGFTRTARFEHDSLRAVLLDLQLKDWQAQVSCIVRLVQQSFQSQSFPMVSEVEYKFQDGEVLIPRLITDDATNEWLSSNLGEARTQDFLFEQPDRAIKLRTDIPGWSNDIVFKDHNDLDKQLGDLEIEIAVKAIGITSQDISGSANHADRGAPFIGEAAGVVRAVGSSFESKFKVGDRVMCISTLTPFANMTCVNGFFTTPIPSSICSYAEAASIPFAYLMAFQSLTKVARLRRNQSVLICHARNDIGQALLALANYVGAEVFAVVHHNKHKDMVIQNHGLEESHVLVAGPRPFRYDLLYLTAGRGVDVVIDNSWADLTDEIVGCVAEHGVLVHLQSAEKSRRPRNAILQPDRDIMFTSFNPPTMWKDRVEEVAECLAQIICLLEEGKIRPIKTITQKDVKETGDALKLARASDFFGKVILGVNDESIVKAIEKFETRICPAEEATYIVAGGLGGLGQAISRYLGKHGVTHILILTRRSFGPEERHDWARKLSENNSKIHILSCRIDDRQNVLKAATYCNEKNLPPVRGVINATLSSRSTLIDRTTAEDFREAIASKVAGTEHLFEVFQDTIESFVALSSVIAIVGSEGSGSYAAANTFLDAFASSHTLPGLKIASINLGPVYEAGYLTQRQETGGMFDRQGLFSVTIDDVLALLSYVLSGAALKNRRRQLIIGFGKQPVRDLDTLEILPDAKFLHLPSHKQNAGNKQTTQIASQVREEIAAATNVNEAYTAILKAMSNKIAKMLGFELDESNLTRPLIELGMDSLVMLELGNWISQMIQVTTTTYEIVDAPSLGALVKVLAARKMESRSHVATDQGNPA